MSTGDNRDRQETFRFTAKLTGKLNHLDQTLPLETDLARVQRAVLYTPARGLALH